MKELHTWDEFWAVKDVPAVTKILNDTKPEQDRLRLEAWKEHTPDWEGVLYQSRERGKNFDEVMEVLITDSEVLNDTVGRFFSSGIYEPVSGHRFLVGDLYKCEIDGELEVFGKPAIADWKTSDKPKKREWWRDELLQLAANGFLLYGKPSWGIIINAVYDQTGSTIEKIQPFVWPPAEMQKAYMAFLARLRKFREIS
jgi:hypothetical protein